VRRRAVRSVVATALAAGFVSIVVAGTAAAATVISVNTTVDESGGAGLCSLRDAITTANTNVDVPGSSCTGGGLGGPFSIQVPAGTYDLTLGEIQVGTTPGADISIVGVGSTTTIIHQTQSTARVFELDPDVNGNVAVTISGVTLSGGFAQAFGGGAILGGGAGDSLSLSGDAITENGCGGLNSGAGLSWAPAGDVTISSSTFSNNICGQAGGAVLFQADGTLTVSGSTFTGNQAGAAGSAGGALFLGSNGGTASFSIDHSTFTGNQATDATGIGGAIYVGSGALTVGTSRFADDVAPHGSALGVRGGTASATEDWWGCPSGPNTAGCDAADNSGGTLTDNPWITFSVVPSPASVAPGGSSTLTASVLKDSTSATLPLGDLTTLIGQPVSWSGVTHGALSGQQTSIQSNGTATATLTQDGSCDSASASAQLDNGPVTAAVSVPCPDLVVTKSHDLTGDAVTGQPFTYTITVGNTGTADATFADGQTVLTDNLALGLSYGSPVVSTPSVSCVITGSDLGCAAAGSLTIAAGGSFTVQLTASGLPGVYANPRSGGICRVNPDGVVAEVTVANNDCTDSITIDRAETTTTITSSVPDPSVVGQAIPVTYTVDPNAPGVGTPSGDVTVSDGTDSCTATVSDGQCLLTFTTAGLQSVVASYLGDTSFEPSTSSPAVPHTADKADTSTEVSSTSPNPSVAGQSVTLFYSVTVNPPGAGTPTGTVMVTDGAQSCVDTVAAGSCSIPFTDAGTHSLTATYSGDANFNASVGTGSQSVVPADTSTTITSNLPDPTVVGQSLVVQFSVVPVSPGAGTPTGTVTVSDGVDSCVDTVATGQCAIQLSTAGLRPLIAVYSGDANFNSSTSSPITQDVLPANTSTSITGEGPDPSTPTQPVLVSYAVTPVAPGAGTPTGSVLVSDGVDSCTGSVAAGSCTLTLTTLGTRNITASYLGDANFLASTSPSVSHLVRVIQTTTAIISNTPNPSVVGQPVDVTFSVTPASAGPTPTGTVTVSGGTTSCTVAVAAAGCVLTFPTAGGRSLEATYSGDGTYASSTSTPAVQQVDAADTTTAIVSAVPNPSDPGAAVTVTYTVTPNAPGAGTPTGTVTVTDGVDSCTGTVAAGSCSVTLHTSGVRTLIATYSGDANFLSSSSTGTAHLVDTPPTATVTNGVCSDVSQSAGTLTFTLFDAAGNPMTFTLVSNSNPTLLPDADVVLTGSGTVRTLSVSTSGKSSGHATLVFSLDDGFLSVPVVVTVFVGTSGDDTIWGTAGTDVMFGMNGNDVLHGAGGNDLLCGGNGDDHLYGGSGNDFLYGGNGNDVLNGGSGNDVMYGQRGDDTLTGGPGADFFSGGPGFDVATDFNPVQGDTTDGTIP
jgi:CSLREA domain-containing protein/uncharacterized repeat protein (TIGR01451 family)